MTSYSSIPSEPEELNQKEVNLEEFSSPPTRSRWFRLFWTNVVVLPCLLTFAFFIIQPLLPKSSCSYPDKMQQHAANQSSHPDAKREPEMCGQSAAEARSLGCVFDTMVFGWLPQRCHDAELEADFISVLPWTWFRDAEATQSMSLVEVMEGKDEHIYVPHIFHMLHCTYMWKKMHRAVLDGRVLDGYIADTHHTNHCQLQLMEQTEKNDTRTYVYNKFITCPWKPKYSGRLGWYRVINGGKVYRNL
jgi:hypothetical protein